MEDDNASQNDSEDGSHGGSQVSDVHGMTDLIAIEASSISKMNVQVLALFMLLLCYYFATHDSPSIYVSLYGLLFLLRVSVSHAAAFSSLTQTPPLPLYRATTTTTARTSYGGYSHSTRCTATQLTWRP